MAGLWEMFIFFRVKPHQSIPCVSIFWTYFYYYQVVWLKPSVYHCKQLNVQSWHVNVVSYRKYIMLYSCCSHMIKPTLQPVIADGVVTFISYSFNQDEKLLFSHFMCMEIMQRLLFATLGMISSLTPKGISFSWFLFCRVCL